MPRRPYAICALCGDRIGVYEPMIAVEDGAARRTSLLREPDLRGGSAALFHTECVDLADTARPVD